MNEQMGLAAMGQQQAPQGGGITVEQVMQALMSGATVEELVAQGVDPAMIEQAIAMLEQQATQQQQPAPEGLAGMQLGA